MTRIKQKCSYACGPYKGYCGDADYDADAEAFHGHVVGTRDIVTFVGSTPRELAKAFQESVDDYLAFCQERGETPEKPFSGHFVTRVEPALHKKVSEAAAERGLSLNQYVSEALKQTVQGGRARGAKAPSTVKSPVKSSRSTVKGAPKASRRAAENVPMPEKKLAKAKRTSA